MCTLTMVDRIVETEDSSTDADAIVLEQLRVQGEAIESLRQAVEAGLKFQLAVTTPDGDRAVQDVDVADNLGEPTEAQLKQIIKLTGTLSEPKDWLVVNFHSSNNIIDLQQRRWSADVLLQMGLDSIGSVILCNHLWQDVEASRGFIFSSAIVTDRDVSEDMLKGAGFEDLNREIVREEGLVWLHQSAAFPANSETANAITQRVFQKVSTGSILHDPVLICPTCSREHGRDVSFMDTTVDAKGNLSYLCPHLVPSPILRQIIPPDEYEQMNFAPFATLTARDSSFVELSLCVQGCLPAAGVLRPAV